MVLTARPQVSAAFFKRLIKSCHNEWLWQVAIRSLEKLSSVMVIVKGPQRCPALLSVDRSGLNKTTLGGAIAGRPQDLDSLGELSN